MLRKMHCALTMAFASGVKCMLLLNIIISTVIFIDRGTDDVRNVGNGIYAAGLASWLNYGDDLSLDWQLPCFA